MLDWSAVFLTSHNNYSEAIAGIGYAVFSIAMALGRWTGDRITQRFGGIQIIRFGGFIAATAVLFATTSAAFGRRAFLTDLAIGIALGVAIFLMFDKLLTLSLPTGPIERLL